MNLWVVSLSLYLVLGACTHSGTSGSSIQTSVEDIGTSSASSFSELLEIPRWVESVVRAETVGQNRSQDLISLKYFVRKLAVCQELTVTQSSYSEPVNCLTLYTRPDNPAYAYTLGTDYAAMAETAREDQVNFVDLMIGSGKSSLGSTFRLSRNHVGIYNWGYIEYYPSVKFSATVSTNDGSTAVSYFSHDGVTTHTGSGVHITESSTGFSYGTPSEATVLFSNGGSWFRLHSPLTVTPSDIDAGSRFLLSFYFNSNACVKSYSNGLTLTGNYHLRDASTVASSNKMVLAPLELFAVARSYDKTVKREGYLLDFSAVTGVSDRFLLRLDLLYVKEDETKAVAGAEASVIYRIAGQNSAPFSVTEVPSFPRISSITRNSDGTLNFLLPDGTKIIESFSRLNSVNSSGTASVRCSAQWAPSACTGVLSVPFSLTALVNL